jgi:arylamine N-acetyltransferase
MQQRYLRLLGIETVPSGIEGLRNIVRRHVASVPFENLSKLVLLGREGTGRFLSLTEFLDGIEHYDFGGTCYAANPHLASLLRALGYQVDLLGADMMTRLNVHTCLRVYIDSVAYHVDVGYGGPFREPIRLDRLPFEIVEGEYRYVLDHADGEHRYEMGVLLGTEHVHGYAVRDDQRTHDFFTPAMQASFQPGATFLNCVRICRFFEHHSVTLLDRTLSIYRGAETTNRELTTRSEWTSAIANELAMPRALWEEALAVLERNMGTPFFAVQSATTLS